MSWETALEVWDKGGLPLLVILALAYLNYVAWRFIIESSRRDAELAAQLIASMQALKEAIKG